MWVIVLCQLYLRHVLFTQKEPNDNHMGPGEWIPGRGRQEGEPGTVAGMSGLPTGECVSGDVDSSMTAEAKCRSSISSVSCSKSVGLGLVSSCAFSARSASAHSVSSDLNSVLVTAGSCFRHCRALLERWTRSRAR